MPDKISKRFYILQAVLLIFSTFQLIGVKAQPSGFARPPVTSKWDEYKRQIVADPEKKMVELKSMIPGLVYDLRYTGSNNFMKRSMYPAGTNITFLRLPAATGLQEIQRDLSTKGLGLKIFDAYRPYSVTVKFWELVKDERYVANPSKGSGHNRGIAVDITLVNSKTGQELDMGTGFDNFTDTAHQSFTNLPAAILQNRSLLKFTMEKHGFKAYEQEWWHYFLGEGSKYEILDIDFSKLKKSL